MNKPSSTAPLSSPPAVVRAVNLTQTFAEGSQPVTVLRGVDFALGSGESAAIIGRSGSGKSTLLHLLGGLDHPTAGEVWLAGERLTGLSETRRGRLRNRHLGFIYQFHHLLPEFTALENAAMPLLLRGMAVSTARATAADWLARVELGERLDHKPSALSGGERQRVAVVRALIGAPSCVLADEPTGNLDGATATAVFELLLALQREQGTSLLIVTHDLTLAAQLDQVWHLDEGQLRPQSTGTAPPTA